MYFLIRKLLYLSTVAFGMGMIAEILVLLTMLIIGQRSVNAISNMIKRLLNCLRSEGGRLFVFGNVN